MVAWHTLQKRQRKLFDNLTIYELNTARFLKKLHIPFKMQTIIFPYIVDFVGLEHNFILEIDGDTHEGNEEYDDRRSYFLENKGYNVFRIENKDVRLRHIEEIIAQVPHVGKIYMRELLIKANYEHYRKNHRQDTLPMRLS